MSEIIPGPIAGPCEAWITAAEVADCCSQDASSDDSIFDAAAVQASMLMYELSGRQFPGLCERLVRPCADPQNSCWTYNWGAGIYAWWGWGAGYGWGWYGPPMGLGGGQQGPMCGCQPLSRVKLAGYPVREILEVKIDGAVLPATYPDGSPQYRLDGGQWLTRMNDPAAPKVAARWPSCQVLALEDDQPGTFSVSYLFGTAPPLLGIGAAKQIACELYAACVGGECKLPNRVTRVVRQGLTQERLVPLAELLRTGATGLQLVDAFIASYNPSGLRRRPAIYSPDIPAYAPKLGS